MQLLGSEEARLICERCLRSSEDDVVLTHVTLVGAAVARSRGMGDVFVSKEVWNVSMLGTPNLNDRIHVTTLPTVTGRSPHRAISAEPLAENAWSAASRIRGRRRK